MYTQSIRKKLRLQDPLRVHLLLILIGVRSKWGIRKMPGIIKVSVLNYMDLPSSSTSSPLSLKVSVGKKEYQTWDKKDDFSFPLANLRDNIFIMIQDADGNEITRTVIQTREVIEKGSLDDLFALEGGGKVHMKLQFVLSEEEHNRIRRIRESVVKKKQGDTSPTTRTTTRATTIGSPLQIERDILAESTSRPQNNDGNILSQPSDPQTYIAKKEVHQEETSPIDTDRSTLETSLLTVSKSSETEENRGNATRNIDVANLTQPSDPQIYTAFHQRETSPNDTDRSTIKTSLLAVSKLRTQRNRENATRNIDVGNLFQPNDPQTHIAKKEEMTFHQQETSPNDTDKSTLETSVLAVSMSSVNERNLGNTTKSPFASLKSISKSRSEGTLISIGKREFSKTPSNVRKMISAFESSQPQPVKQQHSLIAKPKKFAVDPPTEDPSPIRVTKEAESSSKEKSDTGQIETTGVSESLPETKKDQEVVTPAVSESLYEKEPFDLSDNLKEGEDSLAMDSEILFQGISDDEVRPEALTHREHNNKTEASESFTDSWIFPDYNRHLCITTASKKVMKCRIQQNPMKRKIGNSIETKKDEQIPKSSDNEGRKRSVTQVKRVAIMVAYGALVFLTRERNP
ncbi:uncharacterized protein LOC124942501 isoform X2 [Impatiens glandulifera]|uniref:uncharacterized protein LOC124942501 isoform X2 n=1 Tax=Impatiens glandulifera TaxID=253017 RepID=UPI001FB0F31C|nr:uncharacterized protein LOC124942501 isoform X2 [Impatiens glandulifera]